MSASSRVVMLMVLYSILSYFDRTIMSIAGPGIMRDFNLSETQMGVVYSAFLFGYAIAMLPGGYLADAVGPWKTLILMGFGAALFTALTPLGAAAVSGSIFGILEVFSLIRFLLGVFTAPLYPACGRMNANWFPVAKQGLVWGLVAAGAGVGSALSPSLFAWMIPRAGWRISFAMAAAATALLAIAWAVGVRDFPVNRHGGIVESPEPSTRLRTRLQFQNLKRLIANRDIMLLSTGYCAVGYFEYIFFFWIYYYFGQIRGMSREQTSVYTTAIFLSWVVMTPVGGWASDRLAKCYGRSGRGVVGVAGMVFGALLLILGMQLRSPFAVGATLSAAFGMVSSTDGSFWSATIEAGADDVGAACGLLNTGSNIGGFVAPVLTPMIASVAGWSTALYFACVVVAFASAIWFLITPMVGMHLKVQILPKAGSTKGVQRKSK